jgi:hypothetical protein
MKPRLLSAILPILLGAAVLGSQGDRFVVPL